MYKRVGLGGFRQGGREGGGSEVKGEVGRGENKQRIYSSREQRLLRLSSWDLALCSACPTCTSPWV